MAKNAHEKSKFKLITLPKCTKCKNELNLIMLDNLIYVWECPKCTRIFNLTSVPLSKEIDIKNALQWNKRQDNKNFI